MLHNMPSKLTRIPFGYDYVKDYLFLIRFSMGKKNLKISLKRKSEVQR
jgi:hypothetical protein